MSYQAIFDASWLNIKNQGGPGYDLENEACCYFSFQGDREMRCAIGHLLPDAMAIRFGSQIASVYDLSDQIVPVVANKFDIDKTNPSYFSDLSRFLTRLQCAHDDAATGDAGFLEKYEDLMRQVAADHALSTEVMDR
jgi:hypothetical protein